MMQQSVFIIKNQHLARLSDEALCLIDSVNLYKQQKGQSMTQEINSAIAHLSTRLYNIAYLIMLSRAEREGDMQAQNVAQERAKISLNLKSSPPQSHLPADLSILEQRSQTLAKRAQYLIQAESEDKPLENTPHWQLQTIEAAFATPAKTMQGEEG